MVQEYDKAVQSAVQSQEQAANLIGQVTRLAQPETVFSAPISAGGQTLITASEVFMGLGVGFGVGTGEGSGTKPVSGAPQSDATEKTRGDGGAGGGGGGGSAGSARPVAVISVGPEGVKIEPIVDLTKLGIAFFTTLGTMAFMLARMRRN